jgi:hypothetical protein
MPNNIYCTLGEEDGLSISECRECFNCDDSDIDCEDCPCLSTSEQED